MLMFTWEKTFYQSYEEKFVWKCQFSGIYKHYLQHYLIPQKKQQKLNKYFDL